MLPINKSILQNFNEAAQYEWIETNGLGGWSGSTVTGAHTRRYHGLLVASIVPPTGRMVMLSKLDEALVINGQRVELGCNRYGSEVIHPNGHHYIQRFMRGLFPEWLYEAEEIHLKKTIAMVHGENTVLVFYDVLEAAGDFTLELLPLMAARGYHELMHEGPQMHWDVEFDDGVFHNRPDGDLNVFISIPGSVYRHEPRWFYNFRYSEEQYRGLDYSEDLLNHGIFSVTLKKGDSIGVIITTENPRGKNAHELLAVEKSRRKALMNKMPADETLQQLALAADQFIVKRGEHFKTVIAGYHWFTDWGRDTMISLPGLTLSTGRFEDAKKILSVFANSMSQGMLPNRFPDNGGPPEYNNVDGTLWYFIAVYKYLLATGDSKFVLDEILPVLKDILEWHHKGTRFHIHEEPDGLLYSGEEGVQLTWMDAKAGDWVVTPRRGKVVEVQALWYNALRIYTELLVLNHDEANAKDYTLRSSRAKDSFLQQFWNGAGNCLYDVVENSSKDATLRPNQLFAISLPYPLIEGDAARAILNTVEEKLYTPVGLRSLPAEDPRYIGTYSGDCRQRDSSYHQGTVWSWLLGAFIDAVMKVNGEKGRAKAKEIIGAFKYHLNECCVGSVSEIFDGNLPHHPRGCVAQAWGVAEILRVIKDYGLFKEKNNYKK